MKGKHNLAQQLTACILLISLCLQSCTGLNNPLIVDSEPTDHIQEAIPQNPFERCPIEIRSIILERAVIYNYLSYDKTGNLECVCQTWRAIIEQDAMKKSIESIKHEKIYQRFLKGVLIYRPQEGSDNGRIDLPIAALENPLEGTFDLSQCGDVGNYLSISTGYRKGRRAENANKLEIWFVPRFLIEKELTTTAGHFKDIYVKWNDKAPVGIFWTWGGWDNLTYYDYLITENLDTLSNNNLYEKWRVAAGRHWVRRRGDGRRGGGGVSGDARECKISCSFYELK
jgi:hypothetical protein